MSVEASRDRQAFQSRPLGKLIETAPPSFPDPATLKGRTCTIAPLSPTHYRPLFDVLCTPDSSHLWDYMLGGPFLDFSDFESYLNRLLMNARDTALYFTILGPTLEASTDHELQIGEGDTSTQKPMGLISLIDIKPSYRSLEIGNVIYSPQLQHTIAGTEVISLLLHHVFSLGYRRTLWKCNDLNSISKRSALRLGFKYEGVSKCHMIVKGRNRDTAWYSITEDDWPVAQSGFQNWLSEKNFDNAGTQREKLEDIRRRLEQ